MIWRSVGGLKSPSRWLRPRERSIGLRGRQANNRARSGGQGGNSLVRRAGGMPVFASIPFEDCHGIWRESICVGPGEPQGDVFANSQLLCLAEFAEYQSDPGNEVGKSQKQ